MRASRLRRRLHATDPREPRAPTAGEEASRLAVDPAGGTLPHCIDCGCCCFSQQPEYVRVFAIDLSRMHDRARSFTVDRGGRIAMRMAEGRCAALVVDPLARTFACAIYEERPDVCRSLARGSGGCLGDRRDKVGDTREALAQIVARGR